MGTTRLQSRDLSTPLYRRDLVSYQYQSEAYNYQYQINRHDPQPVYQNRKPHGYNVTYYGPLYLLQIDLVLQCRSLWGQFTNSPAHFCSPSHKHFMTTKIACL